MKLIAIVDNKWGIGSNGGLLFDIQPDMERFKTLTAGSVVIMGRKTYESLRIAPLPNRINIVLSTTSDDDNGVTVCRNIAELMEEINKYADLEVFVLGGGTVYNQLIDYCDTAYITKVDSTAKADSYLINMDKLSDWTISEESGTANYNGLNYKFITYSRVE